MGEKLNIRSSRANVKDKKLNKKQDVSLLRRDDAPSPGRGPLSAPPVTPAFSIRSSERERRKAPADVGFVSKTRVNVTLAMMHFPESGVDLDRPPNMARRTEAEDGPLR